MGKNWDFWKEKNATIIEHWDEITNFSLSTSTIQTNYKIDLDLKSLCKSNILVG